MLKDTLLTLLSIPGPSGSEGACADYIEETVRPYVDQIDRDVMGNLICIKHAAEGARRVMLTAHMDEIGFIVTAIEERGFLRVTNIGGVNPKVTTASHVVMKSGAQGVLFTEAGSSNNALFIDIGASSKEEAEKKAQVGDWAVVRGVVSDMGDKIAAPYLDDRSGCAVLIETLKRLKNSKDEIIAVFTTQEEVGLRGALVAGYAVAPDMAIALDVTIAGDYPRSNESNCYVVSHLGKEPAVTSWTAVLLRILPWYRRWKRPQSRQVCRCSAKCSPAARPTSARFTPPARACPPARCPFPAVMFMRPARRWT